MVSKESYALQAGERILVTGANGFIGSNIIEVLLSLGYFVRGTVRSEKPWLNEVLEAKYGAGHFESVNVPKLDNKEALRAVMNGVSGVIHVASDVSFSTNAGEVINTVVAAMEAVLEAASNVPSVKRVVLTSSSVAAIYPYKGEGSVALNQDSWNDTSTQAAWDESTPPETKPIHVYAASKAEGERAAFNWVKKNNPGFTFNSVLPDYTIGQLLHPSSSGSTTAMTLNLLEGDDIAFRFCVSQYLIDVKDLARLHAIALLDSSVKSERLFGCALPLIWKEVVDTLRELRPASEKLFKDEDVPAREGLITIVPPNRSLELLKSFFGQDGWTGLRESLVDGLTSLGK
ncbi:NAD dependent epimerase/dehydratase [Aspergillus californicus]